MIAIYFEIKQFIKCLWFRSLSREKKIRTLKFYHQQIKEINKKANVCFEFGDDVSDYEWQSQIYNHMIDLSDYMRIMNIEDPEEIYKLK